MSNATCAATPLLIVKCKKVACKLAAGRSGAKRMKTSGTAQSSISSSISFVVGGGGSEVNCGCC